MYLDWIAGILELIGLYLVGNKNRLGFLINLSCIFFWVLYVYVNRTTYGILPVVLTASVINIRNYIKWKKENNIKS